jgi:DNA repair protein RadC
MEKDRKSADKNVHKNHRQRVFDRLERDGLDSFYDHEILELLLFYTVPRMDTNPIAHRLINEFGSLAAVMDADIKSLEKVQGVSHKSAVLIKLMPQLIRRYSLDKFEPKSELSSFEKASQYAQSLMIGEKREVFYILCLDIKGRLIKAEKIKEGTASEIVVNPRAVVLAAAQNEPAGVIMVHNHPGGRAHPSAEDIELTRKAALALGLIGIPLLDHIIVAQGEIMSFKRNGLMEDAVKSAVNNISGVRSSYE